MQKVVLGFFFSYVDHENKQDLIKFITRDDEGIMAADKIVKEMSKADNNWYIQNSIWVAKRDENTRKAIAREKGLAEGRAEGRKQGLAEGRAEGRKQGLAEGRAEGLAEGALQKAIEAAIVLIKDFNATPELAAKKMNAPLDKVLEALK